jgi:tight adherence protein B
MPLLLSLLLFAAIVLAGFSLFGWAQQGTDKREATKERLRRVTRGTSHTPGVSLLRDERLSAIPWLDSILLGIPAVLPLVRMVRQAGLRRRAGEIILYIPLLAMIGLLLVRVLGGGWLIALGVAFFLGLIPVAIVSRLRRKRLNLFREQLPEALDLMRSALQAGHGLMASMSVAAETLADPIASELRYVVDETRLGLPLRDALYHLADRVGDPNVPLLIVGILVTQEVGGNLTEVMDNTAHTIRERAKLQRDIGVLTAQSRISALVLTVLPVALFLFMILLNPTYIRPMLQERTGHYMLLYGVCSILVGNYAMRRIIASGVR